MINWSLSTLAEKEFKENVGVISLQKINALSIESNIIEPEPYVVTKCFFDWP